eukprot:scaffold4973_cov135-Cylindrotheca_fusiformis.AAC.11
MLMILGVGIERYYILPTFGLRVAQHLSCGAASQIPYNATPQVSTSHWENPPTFSSVLGNSVVERYVIPTRF